MTGGTAAALVRSLFSGFSPRYKRVAVFVSYSDESGTKDVSGDFFAGGYVAPEDDWPYVARAWQEQVLDGPPELPYLHMIDIRNEEWIQSLCVPVAYLDAQDRVDRACHILSCCGSLRVMFSSVNRGTLQRIVYSKYKRRKDIPTAHREPDYYCYLTYFAHIVAGVRRDFPEADKVDFVVSRKQFVTQGLADAHDDFRAWLVALFPQLPNLNNLVGEFIPGDMQTRLPLQAADVLCWHKQRELSKTATPIDRKRLRLLYGRVAKPYFHEWTEEQLQRIPKMPSR